MSVILEYHSVYSYSTLDLATCYPEFPIGRGVTQISKDPNSLDYKLGCSRFSFLSQELNAKLIWIILNWRKQYQDNSIFQVLMAAFNAKNCWCYFKWGFLLKITFVFTLTIDFTVRILLLFCQYWCNNYILTRENFMAKGKYLAKN